MHSNLDLKKEKGHVRAARFTSKLNTVRHRGHFLKILFSTPCSWDACRKWSQRCRHRCRSREMAKEMECMLEGLDHLRVSARSADLAWVHVLDWTGFLVWICTMWSDVSKSWIRFKDISRNALALRKRRFPLPLLSSSFLISGKHDSGSLAMPFYALLLAYHSPTVFGWIWLRLLSQEAF